MPALRLLCELAGGSEGAEMSRSSEKMVKRIQKNAARSSDRAVVYLNFNILIVISEMLSKQGQAADPFGRLLYLEAEPEIVLGGERELCGIDIRNLQTVDIGASAVDDQHLQQSVLVPVLKPPALGVKIPLTSPKSPGLVQVPRTDLFSIKVMSEGQSLLTPGASLLISKEIVFC